MSSNCLLWLIFWWMCHGKKTVFILKTASSPLVRSKFKCWRNSVSLLFVLPKLCPYIHICFKNDLNKVGSFSRLCYHKCMVIFVTVLQLILPRRWRTVVLICAWSYASSSVCLHPLLCRCIILTPIPTYTPSACLLCFYFFHLSKCNPFSKKGGKSQIKQNVWIWKSCKPLFKINITHHAKYNEMDSYECHISKSLEIRACSSLLETTLHKHFEAEKTKCSSEINFFPIYAR